MYLCLDWFHLQKKTEFKARWSVVSCKAYRTSRGISLEKQYCKHPSQSLKLWVSCWLPSYSHESNSCQHVFWCQDYFKVDLQWLWLFTMFTIWFVWKHAYKKPRVVGYIFFETNSWGSRVHGVHLTVGYVAFFHILPLFDAWACKIGDPDWLSIWERRSMLRKLQPLHCRLFLSNRKEVKSIEINWIPCVSVFRWGNPAAKGGFAHADPLKWGFAFWLPGHFRDLQMMSDVTVEFCSRCVLSLCYARGMAPAANPWSTRGHFPDLGTTRAWDSECTAKIRKTHRDGSRCSSWGA